jgi:hypothetical protein
MLRRLRLGCISTMKSSSSRSVPNKAPVGEAAAAGTKGWRSGVPSRVTAGAGAGGVCVPSGAVGPSTVGGAGGASLVGGEGAPSEGGGTVGMVEGFSAADWEDDGVWSSGGRGRAYASSMGTPEAIKWRK